MAVPFHTAVQVTLCLGPAFLSTAFLCHPQLSQEASRQEHGCLSLFQLCTARMDFPFLISLCTPIQLSRFGLFHKAV